MRVDKTSTPSSIEAVSSWPPPSSGSPTEVVSSLAYCTRCSEAAYPISTWSPPTARCGSSPCCTMPGRCSSTSVSPRSEEHTSELQSRPQLVCRLLLEKKKKKKKKIINKKKKKKKKIKKKK